MKPIKAKKIKITVKKEDIHRLKDLKAEIKQQASKPKRIDSRTLKIQRLEKERDELIEERSMLSFKVRELEAKTENAFVFYRATTFNGLYVDKQAISAIPNVKTYKLYGTQESCEILLERIKSQTDRIAELESKCEKLENPDKKDPLMEAICKGEFAQPKKDEPKVDDAKELKRANEILFAFILAKASNDELYSLNAILTPPNKESK